MPVKETRKYTKLRKTYANGPKGRTLGGEVNKVGLLITVGENRDKTYWRGCTH